MIQSGSPPVDKQTDLYSVSPLDSSHVSRSSTPGISALDGTPRYLFALPTPPSRPRSASTPTPRDMAIKPARHPGVVRQEQSTHVKPAQVPRNDERTPEDPTSESLPREDVHGSKPPRPVPSLPELSHLLRLEQYQSRRCREIQRQLYHVHTTAARNARLVHNTRHVQRTFAECVRSEDKHSFANLLNAFHEALYHHSELPESYDEDEEANSWNRPAYPPGSFLDTLSDGSRTALLEFLARVRHDGSFLADHIAALSQKDLVALLPERSAPKRADSIFGSSPRTSYRSSRHLGFVVDGQTELLSSCDFSSPLDALIHSLRDLSGRRLGDDGSATSVWATVCARLISEQKPGSEKLVPAVIDSWAHSCSWPGKDRLEFWLLDTLQKGSFLLDQPGNQSFRIRVPGRPEPPAEDDVRREAFYTDAVESLLCLLGDQAGASLIPEGVWVLCHAICHRLQHSPGHQRAFPDFVITRWLLPFLTETIALPEAHGLLLDHFVSDNARQSILREVASRCQRVVFDVVYSWKLGTVVPPDTAKLVRSLASRFQYAQNGTEWASPEASKKLSQRSRDECFIAVSATDIKTVVNALYPPQRSASFSDRDPSYSGLQSSSSSISGFSLFQNVATQDAGPIASPIWVQETPISGNSESFAIMNPNGNDVDLGCLATMDGEYLRETCANIEDGIAGRSPGGLEQWCILVSDFDSQRLCTMQEKIFESSNVARPFDAASLDAQSVVRGQNPLVGHRICQSTIAVLLLEDHLIPDQDFSAHTEVEHWLLQACNRKIKVCEDRSDYVEAYTWFHKSRYLREFISEASYPDMLVSLLDGMNADRSYYLDLALSTIDSCAAWLRSMRPCFERFSQELVARREVALCLRDKMWYVADVRLSAAYDEAHSIASALRTMGKCTKSSHAQMPQALRRWSGLKTSATNVHLKTESQILELLSAPPHHGGPNKLGGDQSKALSAWMERNTVENFCRGEERLHKLCMEISKAVDQLTAEGSTLRSSVLFARENSQTLSHLPRSSRDSFWTSQGSVGRLDMLIVRTDVPPSIETMSSASSNAVSAKSSRDYMDAWSPTVTNRSSIPFWSPAVTESRSPTSATSVGSQQTQAPANGASPKQLRTLHAGSPNSVDKLRQHLTSLLLSDIGNVLFTDGSETDRAFWTGVGGELTEKYLGGLYASLDDERLDEGSLSAFDFDHAFEQMTRQFSLSCNPQVKLAKLFDIDALLEPYIAAQVPQRSPTLSELHTRSRLLQNMKPPAKSKVAHNKVDGFRRLFCNSSIRPAAILRDLQYIATLVPGKTLESTPQGKAFWNAAVAVVGLKQEARNIMVETADSIIAFNSNNRGHGRSPSVAQQQRDSATFSVPSPTPSFEDIGRYGMEDAATLLQITAKEGDAAAQRELATLYLTHPELMDHIIAPFSRPRDVFKEELESKWRKNQDRNRCDPTTMCVAHHWMNLSSKGGDALAKEFLRQREEMERLP